MPVQQGRWSETCCCLQLPVNSEWEWNPECLPLLHTTLLDNILFAAADSPPIAPLPFKVKQTLHSASPHSHREKKLVFSHFSSFLLFHPMHPWERGFFFGHPNSGQVHAVQCCIHLFHSLALSHAHFSGGPQLSACTLTAERANLVTCYQSMRQPYYPCWIIPCGGASVAG